MSNTSLLGSYGAQDNSSIIFRNKLYNGCFRVWQRGTSQTSSGYGSDDRWINVNVNSTKTHSQQAFTLGQTDVPGNPEYYSRTVVSSVAGANNYVTKIQRIEGVKTLAGQTATLSFWAKADAPKNMAVEFSQHFGSGGTPSAAISGIGVTTIALTASWKYYTVTVNLPSIAGKTLGTDKNDRIEVVFWFDAGLTFNARTNSLGQQSGTFDIAQVQLEAGPVATPFEHRPYGLELQLCQRYFYQITGNGTDGEVIGLGQGNNTTVARFVVNFPTNMRVKDVSPAIKNSASNFRIYSGSSNITTINTIAGSSRASTWAGHLYVVCGGGLTANGCYSLGFNGEDAISFNAEL